MIWNKFLFLFIFFMSYVNANEIIVSPAVQAVIKSEEALIPSGDFYRAIFANPLMDACIHIDRVNLIKTKVPKIIETLRYCKFDFNGATLSLLLDKHQDSQAKNIKWENNILQFELDYLGKEVSISRVLFKCKIDPGKLKNEFICKLSL